jgi:hypothetical protein
MAARTTSIHVFLGRPLFLLSPGIHSIINFCSLSSSTVLKKEKHGETERVQPALYVG